MQQTKPNSERWNEKTETKEDNKAGRKVCGTHVEAESGDRTRSEEKRRRYVASGKRRPFNGGFLPVQEMEWEFAEGRRAKSS